MCTAWIARPLSERRSLSPEKRGDITLNAYVHKEDERLSIELSYELGNDGNSHPPSPDLVGGHTTYLLCPPGLTVGHLEKLIRLKFELKPDIHRVSIFFSSDDAFTSDFTLTDLACLCSWVRQRPLRLFFSVSTNTLDCNSNATDLANEEPPDYMRSRRRSSTEIPPVLSPAAPASNGRMLLTNGWAWIQPPFIRPSTYRSDLSKYIPFFRDEAGRFVLFMLQSTLLNDSTSIPVFMNHLCEIIIMCFGFRVTNILVYSCVCSIRMLAFN